MISSSSLVTIKRGIYLGSTWPGVRRRFRQNAWHDPHEVNSLQNFHAKISTFCLLVCFCQLCVSRQSFRESKGSYTPAQVLGVDRGATHREIKMAFFAKAKLVHPDVSKEADSHHKFIALAGNGMWLQFMNGLVVRIYFHVFHLSFKRPHPSFLAPKSLCTCSLIYCMRFYMPCKDCTMKALSHIHKLRAHTQMTTSWYPNSHRYIYTLKKYTRTRGLPYCTRS
jgi:hypothetical protein